MNLRFIAFIVLIGSVCMYGYQVYNVPKIEREWAGLMADYNDKTSWSSIGASWFRSIMAGWSGNVSAVFAESDHWDKLGADFKRRKGEIVNAYATALTLKKWSLGVFVCSAIVLVLANISAAEEWKS